MPEVNAREAAMVGGVEVYPVKSLLDVIHFVNTGNCIAPVKVDGDTLLGDAQHYAVDFKDVRGQQTAKRTLEIACAGGHNILMIGPPGSGKAMQCKAINRNGERCKCSCWGQRSTCNFHTKGLARLCGQKRERRLELLYAHRGWFASVFLFHGWSSPTLAASHRQEGNSIRARTLK